MLPETFNLKLRSIIEKLLSDGYIKYNICSITLGSQRMDQLNKFIDGRDLGIKPLYKLLDALGYDLHVTAIAKDNEDERDQINKISEESLNEIQLIFNEYLENLQTVENSKCSQYSIVDNYALELIEKYCEEDSDGITKLE